MATPVFQLEDLVRCAEMCRRHRVTQRQYEVGQVAARRVAAQGVVTALYIDPFVKQQKLVKIPIFVEEGREFYSATCTLKMAEKLLRVTEATRMLGSEVKMNITELYRAADDSCTHIYHWWLDDKTPIMNGFKLGSVHEDETNDKIYIGNAIVFQYRRLVATEAIVGFPNVMMYQQDIGKKWQSDLRVTFAAGVKFLADSCIEHLRTASGVTKYVVPTHECLFCKNRDGPKLCKGCHMVRYCCVEHQNADWEQHKAHCRLKLQLV